MHCFGGNGVNVKRIELKFNGTIRDGTEFKLYNLYTEVDGFEIDKL